MPDRILFIDRDGTLIEEPEDQQVDRLDKVRLVPGVIPALLELARHGFRFVMVTNQDGLGSDAFPEPDFRRPHEFVLELLASQGVRFDDVFICPHLPDAGCDCRKPRTGLLTRFLAGNTIDLDRSAVIGDRQTDMALAERLGVPGLLLDPSAGHDTSWAGIVETLCRSRRRASVERRTRETDIAATVNLDTDAPIEVGTGIGFFDHMLEQVAKHGGFSLRLRCLGDLEIDEHHTVEDTAITLATALRQALGDKRGIGRYGFVVPMDEAQARVAMDLSGRAAFEFRANFPRDHVGELSTEMVEHFFRSLAETLGAALHIEVEGRNTHHMVEACFKGVGRSLRQAIRIEDDAMPSTKGVLA